MLQTTRDLTIISELDEKKYVLLEGKQMIVTPSLESAKLEFFSDWNHLEPDRFLRDGASFRYRRAGRFYFRDDELIPLQSSTYVQSSKINSYVGDVKRTFAPLGKDTCTNSFLHELIRFNFSKLPLNEYERGQPWEIRVHQIRIVTSSHEQGLPTPEGVHRDGVDFIAMHLIARENVLGGVSTVEDDDGKVLAEFEMQVSLDTMILWDKHVKHGVTPINPQDSTKAASRDVLLLGFSCKPDLERPLDQ